MHNGSNSRVFECVLIDLNTQFDFVDATGAHPVLNHRALYCNLRRLVAWAKRNRAPVISSILSPLDSDFGSNSARRSGNGYGGGNGRRGEGLRARLSAERGKLPFTLFDHRVLVVGDNTLSVPVDLLRRYQQVVFPLFGDDLFANPKADRFITMLRSSVFVVYGASVERTVKSVTLGLRARNKPVIVLTDACGFWNPIERELACRQMAAKGAVLATVDEWTKRRLARRGVGHGRLLWNAPAEEPSSRPTRHGLIIPPPAELRRNGRRPRPFSR